MGAGTYITLLSVYTIVLHYRPSYGVDVICTKVPGIVTYVCPEHTYCCSPEYYRCCPETSTADLVMNAFIVMLIVVVICLVCTCCVQRRKNTIRRRGAVRGRVGVVSVDLTPQTCQQVHPSWCIQAQSPYPPPDAYNPYYGIPPPEYQPSAPNPVENPQVLPPQPMVPPGWTVANNNTTPVNNYS